MIAGKPLTSEAEALFLHYCSSVQHFMDQASSAFEFWITKISTNTWQRPKILVAFTYLIILMLNGREIPFSVDDRNLYWSESGHLSTNVFLFAICRIVEDNLQSSAFSLFIWPWIWSMKLGSLKQMMSVWHFCLSSFLNLVPMRFMLNLKLNFRVIFCDVHSGVW